MPPQGTGEEKAIAATEGKTIYDSTWLSVALVNKLDDLDLCAYNFTKWDWGLGPKG